jgi:hypothetical protein
MPLDDKDKEWISNAMTNALSSQFQTFEQNMDRKFGDVTKSLGKRVDRLELAFGQIARVARTSLVSGARENHNQVLRGMFDESSLLLVPPLQQDQGGKMVRSPSTVSLRQVQDLVAGYGSEVRLEVEHAKPTGFRVLVGSFSPQTRRRVAAQFVRDCKKQVMDDLQLLVQYDKPYELREMQRSAHKFLSMVKNAAGGGVTSKAVKGGFLLINDVKLAPEFLVPDSSRWEGLAGLLGEKIRRWHGKQPAYISKDGAFFEIFAAEYAAGRGVFDLSDMAGEDDDDSQGGAMAVG